MYRDEAKGGGCASALESDVADVWAIYKVFEQWCLEIGRKLGADVMGFGGEGQIRRGMLFDLRQALYEATSAVDRDELPEGILLTSAYTGRDVVLRTDDVAIDLTPSRSAQYFLPRTYERYAVRPTLGAEFIPGSGQFIGSDGVKQYHQKFPEHVMGSEEFGRLNGRIVQFNTALYSLKPRITRQQIEGGIDEVNPLSKGEIERIITVYEKSVSSREGGAVVAELRNHMEKLQASAWIQSARVLVEYVPVIRQNLRTLTKTIQARLDLEIPAMLRADPVQRRGELKEMVYFLSRRNRIIIVPLTYIHIGGKAIRFRNFLRARQATDAEFLRWGSRIGRECLLALLPAEVQEQIRGGR